MSTKHQSFQEATNPANIEGATSPLPSVWQVKRTDDRLTGAFEIVVTSVRLQTRM
jgi:hypothetical protein